MNLYYIHKNGQKEGPHDMLMMIKKIRAGKVAPDTMIMSDMLDEPRPAHSIAEFREYFLENFRSMPTELPGESASTLPRLTDLLKTGWEEFQTMQATSIAAGIAVFLIFFFILVLSAILPLPVAMIIASALLGPCFSVFLIFVWEMHHQGEFGNKQLLRLGTAMSIKFLGANALVSAFIFSLPMLLLIMLPVPLLFLKLLLGMFLFFAAMLVYSAFHLAPITFWLNPELEPKEHFKLSYESIRSLPRSEMIRALTIPSLNLVAFFLAIFPVLVVMPITAFSWIEIYKHLEQANRTS